MVTTDTTKGLLEAVERILWGAKMSSVSEKVDALS